MCWPTALTDADIIQAYILPARFISAVRRREQNAERAMMAESQLNPGDQTQTEAFKRWFAGAVWWI